MRSSTTACHAQSRPTVSRWRVASSSSTSTSCGWAARTGCLEPRDELQVREVAGGEERVIDRSSPARGTCDGWATWTGSLTSEREVHLSAASCVGTIAALPDRARGLLGPIDGDAATASAGPLRDRDRDAFVGAVEAAGWEADQIAVHSFEGTTTEPIWRGPCGVAPDDEHRGSTVTILDGQVVMTSDACEP